MIQAAKVNGEQMPQMLIKKAKKAGELTQPG
jgi:hypothetical protein